MNYINIWPTLAFGKTERTLLTFMIISLQVLQRAARRPGWANKLSKLLGLKMINNMSFSVNVIFKAIFSVPCGYALYDHYCLTCFSHMPFYLQSYSSFESTSTFGRMPSWHFVCQLSFMCLAWPCTLRPSGAQPPAAEHPPHILALSPNSPLASTP